jgi:hypothetical protein
MSIRSAFGQNARAREIDQHAAHVRRRLGVRDGLVDLVGAVGSRVHPARDTVGQRQWRDVARPPAMRMEVDHARDHDLAARVDRLGSAAQDAGVYPDDAPACDGNIPDRADAARWIDHAAAADKHVIRRWRRVRTRYWG